MTAAKLEPRHEAPESIDTDPWDPEGERPTLPPPRAHELLALAMASSDDPDDQTPPSSTVERAARPAPVASSRSWVEHVAEVPRSLRTSTSRWRAVAASAIQGGAARVSLVDAQEAAAVGPEEGTEASPMSKVEPAPPPDASPIVERPPQAQPASAPIVEPKEALGAPPRSAPHGVGPRGTVLMAARDVGPRGTVRMRARGARGPTGTLKMRARTDPDDASAALAPEPRRDRRRTTMILVEILVIVSLLLAAWIASAR